MLLVHHHVFSSPPARRGGSLGSLLSSLCFGHHRLLLSHPSLSLAAAAASRVCKHIYGYIILNCEILRFYVCLSHILCLSVVRGFFTFVSVFCLLPLIHIYIAATSLSTSFVLLRVRVSACVCVCE